MITTQIEERYGGTEVFVDGIRIAIITIETGTPAIARFVALCELDTTLPGIVKAADEKRQWNYTNFGQGRNWPELRTAERTVTRLLKQAGIQDS